MLSIFHLPLLPFQKKDLKEALSEETLFFHHKKHHQGYVDKTNELLSEAPAALKTLPIETLIKKAKGELFNNASQMWAHTFYWYSLLSLEKSKKARNLFLPIKQLKEEFMEKGKSHFGSGWLWLMFEREKTPALSWIALHDAESPLVQNGIPLLACDLWEHGYYLDYQNKREAYLKAIFPHLNWQFASETLKRGSTPKLDSLLRNGAKAKINKVEMLAY